MNFLPFPNVDEFLDILKICFLQNPSECVGARSIRACLELRALSMFPGTRCLVLSHQCFTGLKGIGIRIRVLFCDQ